MRGLLITGRLSAGPRSASRFSSDSALRDLNRSDVSFARDGNALIVTVDAGIAQNVRAFLVTAPLN
jgi:hypothetical protein